MADVPGSQPRSLRPTYPVRGERLLSRPAGHGDRLTLPVIAASIGAATLGKLSYSPEKAALRRFRSRRRPGAA
jgi:hypothetical protein